MLLDPYRDPREVWIAQRTDGQRGSGTIDDPYDGSRRDYAEIGISSLSKGGTGGKEATAVTASNHSFATGDMVTINGVGTAQAADKTYAGTFSVGVLSNTSFKYQMLDAPASAVAPGTISCVREREQFDAVMRGAPANCIVHIGPGVFETKGTAPGIPSWDPKSGQRILGSGRAATTLKLVNASWPELGYAVIAQHNYYAFIEGFEVADLTFDCNIAGQPEQLVSCAAIAIIGKHVRLHRLRAINFSSQTTSYVENFVFGVVAPHPDAGAGKEAVNCVIEDCIAEAPGLNSSNNSSVFILSSGERPTDGIMSYHRACAIRQCWYDGMFTDSPVPIAGITISAGVATVTTRFAHQRHNGDWVVIAGAVENGSEKSSYNGSYPISNVSAYQFSYTPVAYGTLSAPTTNPTGDMWVDRFSSHPVSVQKVEKDAGDGTGTTAILTCHGPHSRKPGQWVRVVTVTDPPPAGTAAYYGRFPIIDGTITSPGVLRYRMNSAPDVAMVQDTYCLPPGTPDNPPACRWDTIFLGLRNAGFTTDGGSEAVAEGNRVFNTAAGGSYHDTWRTKDQTDRNNYYSDVLSGPYQNMGGSSALKLGSSLVHDGTIATFTSAHPHGLSAGQSVTIRGAVENFSYTNPYNGTFTVLSNPAPSTNSFSYSMLSTPSSNAGGSPVFGAIQTGTLQRVTNDPAFGLVAIFTKTAHGFNVGDFISVFGVNGATANPYNGVVQIVAKDNNTFTYKLASDPGPTYSGTPTCATAVVTPLAVNGTAATFNTVFPHGLVIGQAVRISPPLGIPPQEFFAVTQVPSATGFKFEVTGPVTLTPPYSFGALWQVGLAIRENNVIELGKAHHVQTEWGYSSAIPLSSVPHGTQYVFRSVIVRDNLIRLLSGSSNQLARAIQLTNAERAVVEDNLIDLIGLPPIGVAFSRPLHFFNNQSLSGALIPADEGIPTEPITDDLRIRIEDALTLAL